MIGTALGLLIGSLASAGASAASGIAGSSAAKSAAATQEDATKYSADLQYKAAQDSNSLQKSEFDQSQQNLQPWLQTGTNALYQVRDLLNPGGALTQGFKGNLPDVPNAPTLPNAPTSQDVQNQFDPGFQYRMDQSNKALQSWAASKGILNSGGTGQKLVRNAQDMASQEYQNAFSRAQQTYSDQLNGSLQSYNQALQKYGAGLQGYGAAENTFNTNQTSLYNRLAGLAGVGQQAVTQSNQLNSNLANNETNTNLTAATNIGNSAEQGANAAAAGTVGSSNAYSSALGGIASSLSNYGLLNAVTQGKVPVAAGANNTYLSAQNFQPGYARG